MGIWIKVLCLVIVDYNIWLVIVDGMSMRIHVDMMALGILINLDELWHLQLQVL